MPSQAQILFQFSNIPDALDMMPQIRLLPDDDETATDLPIISETHKLLSTALMVVLPDSSVNIL